MSRPVEPVVEQVDAEEEQRARERALTQLVHAPVLEHVHVARELRRPQEQSAHVLYSYGRRCASGL